MAHLDRLRLIEPSLLKSLAGGPIVGLIGHRQTGKTTLVSKYSQEYKTLDLETELAAVQSNPMEYLRNRQAPFGIDECQLCPPLFPALKESVRRLRKPGQFFITGSVRFSSLKQIRESLTGRILLLELLPFSLAETLGVKPNNPTQVESLRKKPKPELTDNAWDRYLNLGGLPGLCFLRSAAIRKRGIATHISTLLDRDLRRVYQTTLPLVTLVQFAKTLSLQTGKPLDLTEIATLSRVSRRLASKLIEAFEALFLIRRLETRGGVKSSVLFMEDIGLLRYLSDNRMDPSVYLWNAFYQTIRCPLMYALDWSGDFFQYRTRGGAFIPVAIDEGERGITGYLFSNQENPDRSTLESARSFIRHFGKDTKVFILGKNLQFREIQKGITLGNLLTLV